MSRKIIIFIILLFGFHGFAQAQQRYVDTTQVLCVGTDNRIKIEIPNTSNSFLEATAQGGTIEPVGKNVWEAHPFSLDEDFIITLYKYSVSGIRNKLFSYTYKVKECEKTKYRPLDVYIVYKDSSGVFQKYRGAMADGPIGRTLLVQAENIVVEEIDTGVRYKVTRFEFEHYGAITEVFSSDGDRFTDAQRNYLGTYPRSYWIYINIYMKTPDGTERALPVMGIMMK